jgi:hypothetical protein
MKLISTRLHAGLDYLAAICMYCTPIIWRFDGPTKTVLISVAVFVVVYGLLTKFEYSLFKLIPTRIHLGLDALACLVLFGGAFACDHSLIGYRIALATFGIAGLITAALTNPEPEMTDIPMSTSHTPAHHV